MKIKKRIAILIAVVMCISCTCILSACGDKQKTNHSASYTVVKDSKEKEMKSLKNTIIGTFDKKAEGVEYLSPDGKTYVISVYSDPKYYTYSELVECAAEKYKKQEARIMEETMYDLNGCRAAHFEIQTKSVKGKPGKTVYTEFVKGNDGIYEFITNDPEFAKTINIK